jgi:acyl carrier protein
MSELHERIKRCIIERLELDVQPADIADDAQLFTPLQAGGLDLDSLAAIEIIVALGIEFNLQLDEVPREAFESITTLSAYVHGQLDRGRHDSGAI